jgi:FkbM family methyltransferase
MQMKPWQSVNPFLVAEDQDKIPHGCVTRHASLSKEIIRTRTAISSCGSRGSKMMAYLERFFNTLAALEHPGALRQFFTSKAFSTPCFRLNLALKAHQPHFETILDVGANTGQFALAADVHFPEARIYSFEPLPDVFNELQENTRRKRNIKLFNCALGNHNGPISFYRNEYTRLSSSLKIKKTNKNLRYDQNLTSLTKIEVIKLDNFETLIDMQPPVLLKIDVQGMEIDVLNGGLKLLSKVDFIVCEVALVQLYDDQPLFDDIHCFMRNTGYELVAPLFMNKGKGGKIIEVDLFYRKKSIC